MHVSTAVEHDTLMMKQLYDLFFSWSIDGEIPGADQEANPFENMSEEEKLAKLEQEKEEKRKKEEHERE